MSVSRRPRNRTFSPRSTGIGGSARRSGITFGMLRAWPKGPPWPKAAAPLRVPADGVLAELPRVLSWCRACHGPQPRQPPELCLLKLGNLALPVGPELHVLDSVVQLDDRVDQHLRPRRAARQVDVDRDDVIHALDDGVVVEHAAARCADAHRDHPLGLGHLVVDLPEHRCHLLADPACDDHQVGLPRRRRRPLHPEPGQVVPRPSDGEQLDSAARQTERGRPDRTLAGITSKFLHSCQQDSAWQLVLNTHLTSPIPVTPRTRRCQRHRAPQVNTSFARRAFYSRSGARPAGGSGYPVAGGSGGIAPGVLGASKLVTSSLLPTICLSMKSWLRSRTARVSAAITALRLRLSSLSCCCSPDRDQLVEPLTVYTPSTITIFRCEMALWTELVPMAMLLPNALLAQLASICFSCAPVAWLRSRLICT